MEEVGALAIDGVCPARHPLRVTLELPSEAAMEVLWSVARPDGSPAGLRACWWPPFGVGGPAQPSPRCSPSLPSPAGMCAGPKGQSHGMVVFWH